MTDVPINRNQSTNLLCKSMDCFLYGRALRHERLNHSQMFEVKDYGHFKFNNNNIRETPGFWIANIEFIQPFLIGALMKKCLTIGRVPCRQILLHGKSYITFPRGIRLKLPRKKIVHLIILCMYDLLVDIKLYMVNLQQIISMYSFKSQSKSADGKFAVLSISSNSGGHSCISDSISGIVLV